MVRALAMILDSAVKSRKDTVMDPRQFLTRCPKCQGQTTKAYVRKHGQCKQCAVPAPSSAAEERTARIIDCGWQAYATEEGHYSDYSDR